MRVFSSVLFCYKEFKLRHLWVVLFASNESREVIYPDWKFPLSVPGQNQYNIWTPIHQRGAQTLNKQARTDGEIKDFAANTNAVANRSYQAENLG